MFIIPGCLIGSTSGNLTSTHFLMPSAMPSVCHSVSYSVQITADKLVSIIMENWCAYIHGWNRCLDTNDLFNGFHPPNIIFVLTPLVLKPEYYGRTRLISGLLMSWLLASPAMVLALYSKQVLVFYKGKFQWPVPTQRCEIIEITNIYFMFLKEIQPNEG